MASRHLIEDQRARTYHRTPCGTRRLSLFHQRQCQVKLRSSFLRVGQGLPLRQSGGNQLPVLPPDSLGAESERKGFFSLAIRSLYLRQPAKRPRNRDMVGSEGFLLNSQRALVELFRRDRVSSLLQEAS